MKPSPFDYAAPATLAEALELRARHAGDSVLLAGGQSLVPMLNLRLAQPAVVIDLNGVAELARIEEHDGGLSVGALVRQRAAERAPLVQERAPLLVQALLLIGHPQIRNRGTVGGSLAHADPAAELPAAAVALDAEIVVRSAARGERVIAAADFFQGFLTTALEPDELLVALRVPRAPAGAGFAFEEVTRRHGDFALVGAAAAVAVADGVVTHARLALIGVAQTPVRVAEAEEQLVGGPASEETFAAAAEAVAAALEPHDDVHATGAYRRHVAGVLARRVLAGAAA